jgi:hypothetical protein
MTTLNLGVVDVPYSNAKGVTTGDVAGFLENRYHVMEIFYEINQEKIAASLADSVAGALESVLMGGPADSAAAFAAGTSVIEAAFKDFLSLDVMASLGYPGVPTAAALAGVSPRFKNGKGPPRPSFISSGLYEASFRAWIE